MTDYPIGPLSLQELEYWLRDAHLQTVRYCGYCVLDVVAWANERKAQTGIYPTYGHISNTVRRWHEWGSDEDIAKPMLTVQQMRVDDFLATL